MFQSRLFVHIQNHNQIMLKNIITLVLFFDLPLHRHVWWCVSECFSLSWHFGHQFCKLNPVFSMHRWHGRHLNTLIYFNPDFLDIQIIKTNPKINPARWKTKKNKNRTWALGILYVRTIDYNMLAKSRQTMGPTTSLHINRPWPKPIYCKAYVHSLIRLTYKRTGKEAEQKKKIFCRFYTLVRRLQSNVSRFLRYSPQFSPNQVAFTSHLAICIIGTKEERALNQWRLTLKTVIFVSTNSQQAHKLTSETLERVQNTKTRTSI